MRAFRHLGVILVLSCGFAGCVHSRAAKPSYESPIEPRPKTIGVVLPLSGDYGALGQEVLKGIRLALAGSGIKIIVRDSRGEGPAAEKAVEELANGEKVVALLGGLLQEEALRAAQKADALGVTFVTFTKSEGVTAVGPYVFRDMLTLRAQAKAIARYATAAGLKTAVVFQPDTSYGKELALTFTDDFRSQGGDIKSTVVYPAEQTSFTAEAQKLTGRQDVTQNSEYQKAVREIETKDLPPHKKRKALERARAAVKPVVDFQAVFIADDWKKVALIAPALAVQDVLTAGCDPEEVSRAEKTLGREDIPKVTLLGWNGWSSPNSSSGVPGLLERGGKYVRCSVFVDAFFLGSERPATRSFVQSFRETHGGQEPTLLAAVGFESAGLYRRIFEHAGAVRRVAFREQLVSVKDYLGPAGLSGFGSEGEPNRALFLLKVESTGLAEVPGSTPRAGRM